MKISVNKYALDPRTVDGGTAGSQGLESLEFDFSPEWNDLSRTVTFFPPKSVAKCVSFTGSTVPLPGEVTRRAGKTAYVLCGAKDGMTIITLSGVIEVAETLLPTEEQTEEYTPGALAQATLLCTEARSDALTAAASAEAAASSYEEVSELMLEIMSAKRVMTEIYDEVIDKVNVREHITDGNSSDTTHAPSVSAVTERLDLLLQTLCPFYVKAVSALPKEPDTGCIYLHDGKAYAYTVKPASIPMFKWQPTYTYGGGPATIYTMTPYIEEGTVLYWGVDPLTHLDNASVYTDVTAVGDVYITAVGRFTAELLEEISVLNGEMETVWSELTSADDVTPYLRENPVKWLITGGAA